MTRIAMQNFHQSLDLHARSFNPLEEHAVCERKHAGDVARQVVSLRRRHEAPELMLIDGSRRETAIDDMAQ
ncbi:MAG: hypothetical protein ABIR16_07510, partial [Dokdonella sp.]